MDGGQALAPVVGTTVACAVLGVPRSTVYRHRRRQPCGARGPSRRQPHPRALTPTEQAVVRATLNSERFVDQAPRTISATLLDEGQYLCHWRTMYRLLRADQATRERRAVRRHPVYARPELLATAPRQVWSWDITKLRGPQPGVWYNLYVVLDIFSRMVVGWLLADREDALLAEQVLADAYHREGLGPSQLPIHADRGAPMTAKVVADLLVDLGVRRSHCRPRVSNDNPYSEAQFKTMKYGPAYPGRFASLGDTRAWVTSFVQWYNHEHRHSGLGLLTPAMIHSGAAATVVAARQAVLTAAAACHPERFVRGQPTPPTVPTAAWINPPLITMPSTDAPACLKRNS
ncbi:MAG TPA: IS3 family transposase [Herpetosiphonaceae bacterium]